MAQIENIFSIVCASDCSDVTNWIAVDDIDPDCPPIPDLAEVNKLLIMHPDSGVAPADWTVTAAGGWGDVIDNSDATGVKVKRFEVSGDVPDAEAPDIEMTNLTTINGTKVFTVNLTIKSVTQTIYDYWRGLECGNIKPIFWYTSIGGFMYGDATGIQASSIKVQMPKERGEDSYDAINIALTFRAKTNPDRITDPLA